MWVRPAASWWRRTHSFLWVGIFLEQQLVLSDSFPFSLLFSLDNRPFISSSSQAICPVSSPSFLFPLLRVAVLEKCPQSLLHNIITMDACAYQAVLYQTLSQHIAPMAIRLILASFSRPAMVGNWTVSPNVFSTVMTK